ncbi:MAG TPA: hypothetical protein ENL10_01010, partial [Candidatus Cloacimonetes bacterium]|nr:hypothetical protein [Candidatus Cloacimonadota bacterium]
MKILYSLSNLFFPPQCFSCNKRIENSAILCKKCTEELARVPENSCTFCNKTTIHSLICEECKKEYPFDEVVCAYTFNIPIQRMIHHFKYNEFKKIGKYLGSKLAKLLSSY